MINFQHISANTFLTEYWQKKPLVIRNALPGFVNPLTPDELAGLSLEEDIESRIVFETPKDKRPWHVKKGPFSEEDFASLPPTHWTLLVQGVDRIIPEVYALLHHFDFIPQWRFDDVMISYATLQGSVGPHYDNYDVFLYQGMGRRKWLLTTQECHEANYVSDVELRIMREFKTEETIILEEGDMLYLPAHVGHHGISLSEACMTWSFGYRSYQGQELWDSLGDYLSENNLFAQLYQDPDWNHVKNPAELTKPAWQSAQALLLEMVNNDQIIKSWFGCFSSKLDSEAEQQLPVPMDDNPDIACFLAELAQSTMIEKDATCRFVWEMKDSVSACHLYINGVAWNTQNVSTALISLIANNRYIPVEMLKHHLNNIDNQLFFFELWKLRWLVCQN